MVPKGMTLKLLLLSSNVVEKFPEKNYLIYKEKLKDNNIKLSQKQKQSLKKMNISNFIGWDIGGAHLKFANINNNGKT